MKPAYIDVWYGDKKYEFLGLECGKCGSKWLTRDELVTGLKKVAAEKPAKGIEEEYHLAVE